MTIGIEAIKEYLPADWEEKCKELGALSRGRKIKTAEELLTLNLLYMTEGESLQITSALMKPAGISVNKNAVHERIKGSREWLGWLAKSILSEHGFLVEKPDWLQGKELCLVDGSELALKGSKGGDYMLHYMFSLFEFSCRQFELTEKKEGERLSLFEFKKGDIVIGDRNYGNMKAIEYVKEKEAEFILRLKTSCFKVFCEKGNEIDILEYGKSLKEWESTELECYYKHDKEMKPLKLCIMKKGAKKTQETEKKIRRKANRNQRQLSEKSIKHNNYIVAATNLPYTSSQIFELYRARWQIEPVFKRLKSIFGFGSVPSKNPDSVKAWFYGKLLLAGICEASVKKSHFPPAHPSNG